jgi:hypothetical protein
LRLLGSCTPSSGEQQDEECYPREHTKRLRLHC